MSIACVNDYRTVLEYIRWRRGEQARHLLIHTNRPVKEIAVEVGMPDSRHFNKSIRGAFGVSLRAFRATGESSSGKPDGRGPGST